MTWLTRVRFLIRNLFGSARADRALEAELQSAVELLAADYEARGLTPDAARRAAKLELGGTAQVAEEVRSVRLGHQLSTCWRDLRYAARALMTNRTFSVAATLTLALGFAGATTMFTLVHAIVLEPLPYPGADRLVVVRHVDPQQDVDDAGLSPARYDFYRERARSIEALATYSERVANLSAPDVPTERVQVTHARPELFDMLGVRPTIGRLFTNADAAPGFRDGTWPIPVLLSHQLWATRFHSDPAVVGRMIRLGNSPRLVVGVLPASFAFPRPETQVWMLMVSSGSAIARLREGFDAAQAAADLRQAQSAFVADGRATRQELARAGNLVPTIVPLKDEIVGDVGARLWLLFGGMGVLLIVACANVTNLSLLRADRRTGELAIRAALGAGTGDVARLLLSEAFLLASVGTALGLALAVVALQATVALAPADLPRLAEVRLGNTAMLFAAVLGFLSTMLLGGLPLIGTLLRPRLSVDLRSHHFSGVTQRGSQRTRHAFVAVQVALALALLTGSALMAQSFWQLMRVAPGFEPAGVLTVEIGLTGNQWQRHQLVYGAVLDRLRRLPGVEQAGAISTLPLDGGVEAYPLSVPDRPNAAGDQLVATRFFLPGYFQVMRTPLRAGSAIAVGQPIDWPRPVVVSESLARRLFPNEDAVGKPLARRYPNGAPLEVFDRRTRTESPAPPFTIAGVVADVYDASLRSTPPEMLYIPVLDPPVDPVEIPTEMSVVLRTSSASPAIVVTAEARSAIQSNADPLSIARIRPMDSLVTRSIAGDRVLALLLLVAAAMAVFLGAVGVYGVVAQIVRRREREIGIRTALGAAPVELLRVLVTESVVFVLAGAATGLLGILAAARGLRSFLFHTSATDPMTLAVVSTLLVTIAVLAALLPARRALGSSPIVSLRGE